MTLLNGNVLDSSSSSPLRICLSRLRGEEHFSTIEVGDLQTLANHYKVVKDLLSSDLTAQLIKLLPKEDSDSEAKSSDEESVSDNSAKTEELLPEKDSESPSKKQSVNEENTSVYATETNSYNTVSSVEL